LASEFHEFYEINKQILIILQAEYGLNVDLNDAKGQQKLINFANTVLEVEEHNIKYAHGEVSFMLKENSRAVLSLEEKRASMNGLTFEKKAINFINQNETTEKQTIQPEFPPAPDSLDYRKYGYVTDVVDQGEVEKALKSSKIFIISVFRFFLFKLLRIFSSSCN
jgi:hypothetical protein